MIVGVGEPEGRVAGNEDVSEAKMPCAMGLRQMLPRQTKRMRMGGGLEEVEADIFLSFGGRCWSIGCRLKVEMMFKVDFAASLAAAEVGD